MDIVKPERLDLDVDIMNDNNRQCGANNFFFDNRTIHFILTMERDCIV